jgi:glycosyltransferase involved in cell wall biosynthesis
LKSPGIEFVGEIDHSEKSDFLGGAIALLCPIQWPEPFGLVMIEAMACGTPVISYARGSVPELLEDGVNGFIVADARRAAHAARVAPDLSRSRIRDTFEQRFSALRMCEDYLSVYQQLLDDETVLTASGLPASSQVIGGRARLTSRFPTGL